MLHDPQSVLLYWFDSPTGPLDVASIELSMKKWFFGSSKEFDDVQKANSKLIDDLAQGEVDALLWNVEDDPMSLLAKVIVLDQFSRAVYRGQPKAFSNDDECARLVRIAWNKGWFQAHYSPIQRFFLGVAIQHSERMEDQELGVEIASVVGADASDAINQYFKNLKGYPMEHHDVIQQFGRFPHRNIIMGRETTAEEQAWLLSDQCPGWAKSQAVPKAVKGSTEEASV